MTLTVLPGAYISATDATLTSPESAFGNYTGSTNLTYKLRTSNAGNSGLSLQVTGDAGGPAAAQIKFQCTASATSGLTNNCSSPQTAAAGGNANIFQFGGNFHSSKAGDSITVNWIVEDDPAYTTGTHVIVAQFTISAT